MGAWGTGITQNDEILDVNDLFKELFTYSSLSIEEIEEKIISNYKEEYNFCPADDGIWDNIYFGIALNEWKCGCLSKKMLDIVSEIILSGADIKYWKELEATEADLKLREKRLLEFLEKLKSENKKPTQRKIRNKREVFCDLNKGDVFWLKSKGRIYFGLVLDRFTFKDDSNSIYHCIALSDVIYSNAKEIDATSITDSKIRYVGWLSPEQTKNRNFNVIGNISTAFNNNDYADYFRHYRTNDSWGYYGKGYFFPDFKTVLEEDFSFEEALTAYKLDGKKISDLFDLNNLTQTSSSQRF